MAESADALDSGSSEHYKLVWVQVPPPAPVTLGDVLSSLEHRTLTIPTLIDQLWSRIMSTEPVVHAFVALNDPAHLSEQAPSLATRPLRGVPIAVKDNLCTVDLPTTCGSAMLQDFKPRFEATAVARLRAAGAQVQGKTNLDEFAMGSSTEHTVHGPTRNPHDPQRVPGGSSGGSAAAVACGSAVAALGSDTGGSVRQPAALCGVVGLRPSYGLVSRWGLVAFASSLDAVGLLTSCVADAARLLSIIAGHDPRDATSLAVDIPDYAARLREDLRGLRVGIPLEFLPPVLGDDTLALIEGWSNTVRQLGGTTTHVRLPSTRYALPAYYVLASAEASTNLARYDGVRYPPRIADKRTPGAPPLVRTQGFGREAKRRIALGTFALSAGNVDAYYRKAQQAKTSIAGAFTRCFDGVDLLMTPTTPTLAFGVGERTEDPVAMYHSDVFTVPASLAGLPAVSIPGGTLRGLPFGLQLIAPRLEEARLLSAAYALEQALRYGDDTP